MQRLTRMAVAVVEDVRGRVLLARCGRGRWDLPGGPCDACGAPDRELTRALGLLGGLDVRIVDLVGLYHASGDGTDTPPRLTYAFRCEALTEGPISGEPGARGSGPEDPGGAVTLSWHPARHIPTPVAGTACAVLTDVVAGRSGVVRHLARQDS